MVLRCLRASALLLLLAVPARATNYYVDGSVAGAGSGTIGDPWQKVSSANPGVTPGDTVFAVSLCVTVPSDTSSATANKIDPSVAGTMSQPIVYYGSPGTLGVSLPIPSLTITKSYIRVEGFRSRGSLVISTPAVGSVIDRCYGVDVIGHSASRNSRISHCRLINAIGPSGPQTGTVVFICGYPYNDNFTESPTFDTLLANYVDCGNRVADSRVILHKWGVSDCAEDSNSYVTNFTGSGTAETYNWYFADVVRHTTHYNRIQMTSSLPGGTQTQAFVVRGGGKQAHMAHDNTFIGDTVIVTPGSTGDIRITFGQVSAICLINSPPPCGFVDIPCDPNDEATQCLGSIPYNNRFYGGYYQNPGGNTWLFCAATGYVFRNNTFLNFGNYGFQFWGLTNGVDFRYNTVYSRQSYAIRFFEGQAAGSGNNVQQNIFFSDGSVDAVTRTDVNYSNMSLDRNLYYSTTIAGNYATRQSGVTRTVANTCSQLAVECNGLWGDPAFSDTSWAHFNPIPKASSAAIGFSWPQHVDSAAVGPGGYDGIISNDCFAGSNGRAATTPTATQYFMNPTIGLDANDGLSSARPWKTVAKANAALAPAKTGNGDINVKLAAGTYDAMPKPPVRAANGKRYRFIGLPSDSTSYVVPVDTTSFGSLTLNGLSLVGALKFYGLDCTADSVTHCKIAGTQLGFFRTSGHAVEDCRIFVGRLKIGTAGDGVPDLGALHSTSDISLKRNVINNLGYDYTYPITVEMGATGSGRVFRVENLSMFDNRLTVYQGNAAGQVARFYGLSNCNLKHNRYELYNRGVTLLGGIDMSDSLFNVHVTADSVFTRTQTGFTHRYLRSGLVDGPKALLFDSLYFKSPGGPTGGSVMLDGLASNASFRYCQFLDNDGAALRIDKTAGFTVDSLILDHCTLVGRRGGSSAPEGGILEFGPGVTFSGDSSKATNTIIYNQFYGPGFYRPCTASLASGLYISSGATSPGRLIRAWNLYRQYEYRTIEGDRCVWTSDCATTSRPTEYGTGPGSKSQYKTPLFSDSLWASFTARPDSTSPTNKSFAIRAGKSGSTIGAWAFDATPRPEMVVDWMTYPASPLVATNSAFSSTFRIRIKNTNPRWDLHVTSVDVSNALCTTAAPLTIPPDSYRWLAVTYNAPVSDPADFRFYLTLNTDDPSQPALVIACRVGPGPYPEE